MPRNTIRGFGKHLIDAAFLDPAQHCPQAGPCVFVDTRGAMYCIVRERFGDQFTAFALAPLAANPDLVFDRTAVLKRARKAGIDDSAHGRSTDQLGRESCRESGSSYVER